eukprot:3778189-Alexandrium_andersonii.AAC.1
MAVLGGPHFAAAEQLPWSQHLMGVGRATRSRPVARVLLGPRRCDRSVLARGRPREVVLAPVGR